MNHDGNQLTCAVCGKNMPDSPKVPLENSDCVIHFCGLKCRCEWKHGDVSSVESCNVILNPEKYFKGPAEVVSDPLLTNKAKLAILKSWKVDSLEIEEASEENMDGEGDSRLSEVCKAIIELERSS